MWLPIASGDPFFMGPGPQMPSSFVPRQLDLPIFDPTEPLQDMAGAGIFVMSFAKQFAADNQLTEIEACADGLKSEEAALQAVIADFKKGDIGDIIAGAKALISVLGNAKSDLKKCESLDGDIQKIGAWGSNVIKNPKSIIQNILANGGDIIKEVPASVSDFNSQNYDQAGKDVEKVVIDMFGKVSSKYDDSEIDAVYFF